MAASSHKIWKILSMMKTVMLKMPPKLPWSLMSLNGKQELKMTVSSFQLISTEKNSQCHKTQRTEKRLRREPKPPVQSDVPERHPLRARRKRFDIEVDSDEDLNDSGTEYKFSEDKEDTTRSSDEED